MPRKNLDISLIPDNKSDLTFFNIDEDESNETLKALKQTYVTTNYKEETILNLQSTLSKDFDNTSKELKLESYKRYNNALDLAYKHYITSAIEMIDKAAEINPKDVDILNLRGLLRLLKCDFKNSFESFYTSLCYGNNELSRTYVDLLSSPEYNTFLARYNHSIRFINEEMNHESIQILNNIINEEPNLIEPYVILALLYDKLGNVKKRKAYLERLRSVDMDNPIFEENKPSEDNIEKEEVKKEKRKKKNHFIPYAIIGCLVVGMGVYAVQNKKKLDLLNNQLTKKEEKLTNVDKELNEANEKLDELNNKEPEKEVEVVVASEEGLFNDAIKLKDVQNYEKAIESFKKVVDGGKTKKYISESIYQIALLNEKLGNKEEAIKYYKKYINTYTAKDQLYDDAFYQLGMLYYDDGQLEKAKETFYGLRSEAPDSMYYNSKVKDILKK